MTAAFYLDDYYGFTPQREEPQTCPVCGSRSHLKPMGTASVWISCEHCGNYDITRACRERLEEPDEHTFAEDGPLSQAERVTILPRLWRHLRETKDVAGRVVTVNQYEPLPKGTSVRISLCDMASLYNPTGDLETDYRAALEAWENREEQSQDFRLVPSAMPVVFPFIDYEVCEKILSEAVRRSHAARILNEESYYLTPEGGAFLTGAGTPAPREADLLPAVDLKHNSFRKTGDYWTLVYDQATVQLKDTTGVRELGFLLKHPRKEYRALHLIHEVKGTPYEPDEQYAQMSGQELAEEGLHAIDRDDTGPIMDSKYEQDCRSRLQQAISDLNRAKDRNDVEAQRRAQKDVDQYRRALEEGIALGGRHRTAGSPTEKARVSVTHCIKRVLNKLRKQHPTLYEHLASCVKTGDTCTYAPQPPVDWKF